MDRHELRRVPDETGYMTLEMVLGPAPAAPRAVNQRRVRPKSFRYYYYDWDRNKWFRLKWRRAWKAVAQEIN